MNCAGWDLDLHEVEAVPGRVERGNCGILDLLVGPEGHPAGNEAKTATVVARWPGGETNAMRRVLESSTRLMPLSQIVA